MYIFCRIKMCILQISILQKCIGVESIESTRSCSKANQKFVQREKYEYVAISVLCRNATVNA